LVPDIVKEELKDGGVLEIFFDFHDAVTPFSLGHPYDIGLRALYLNSVDLK
jgi:hypothetical protein